MRNENVISRVAAFLVVALLLMSQTGFANDYDDRIHITDAPKVYQWSKLSFCLSIQPGSDSRKRAGMSSRFVSSHDRPSWAELGRTYVHNS